MSHLRDDSNTLRGHPSSSQSQVRHDSSNDSQATTLTSNDTDRVFTPPESDSEGSIHHGTTNQSSQESQLMQLSNLAAQQQKMMVSRDEGNNGIEGQSKKRMADGVVKHTRHHSSTSPIRMGHSRNTSTVSVASTAGSRISELSAELKAKLSYAMVKVNHGWQSHSIDEVESLASQAASPTSSTSTLHGRHGSSASPRPSYVGVRHAISNPPSTVSSPALQHPPHGRTYESFWRENASRAPNATSPISSVPSLAPPASIQPRQPGYSNPRRNSTAKYAPAYLSHPHHASPHTPAQPSPLQGTPNQILSTNADPILFSPPQNLREQEALETLVFMSSPGNSANLKHTFPSSQQRNGGRTALPTSRLGQTNDMNSPGRGSQSNGRFHNHQQTRTGVPERSPMMYDEAGVEEQFGTPRGMPRRKTINGPAFSVPAGLAGPSRSRPPLEDEDIKLMIERAATDDSSDSEGEIQLPPRNRRTDTGVGV